MKQYSHTFFLLFAFILLQYSCKKNEPSEPNVSSEDVQPIKDYCYFQIGTYWIYEDSRGNVDSMFVFEAFENIDTVYKSNGDIDGIFLTFSNLVHSTFDSYDYRIFYTSSKTSFNPKRHKVFMNKTKPGDYVGEIILLEYPSVIGNILYSYNDNTITTDGYYEQYSLSQINFEDVIKMHETRDVTNDYFQPTNYYIAKNVGIIQEELIDSSNVWKLIRYNIVQ